MSRPEPLPEDPYDPMDVVLEPEKTYLHEDHTVVETKPKKRGFFGNIVAAVEEEEDEVVSVRTADEVVVEDIDDEADSL